MAQNTTNASPEEQLWQTADKLYGLAVINVWAVGS
jgi:hypothetical protein